MSVQYTDVLTGQKQIAAHQEACVGKWPILGNLFMMSSWSDRQVQGAVHGVTLEECKAALQGHNWNIPQAINHLKVRLFVWISFSFL